jgi:FAD/FMN-containing dehydrogenase
VSEAFLDTLAAIVGPAHVLCQPADMLPFLTDWRGQRRGSALAVVRPGQMTEVAAVLRAAGAAGVAVLPQGGNTGLAYGTLDTGPGQRIILSLGRMDRIRALDPVGLTMEVEAGCILHTVRQAALAAGRQFPVSLAAEGSATIGGIIAANAGGVNVLRHGMTRALVLGLEVVLADGTVLHGLRALRKDNAGYDWKHWFIGSEGTLGVVTAATLRLLPRPRHTMVALLAVADPAAALALLVLAQEELGDAISAFELMAGSSLALVERHFGLAAPIAPAPWFVLMEAQASLPGLAEATDSVLATALERGHAGDGVVAASDAQAQRLWSLREHITLAEAREGASIKHDIAVPVPAMPGFLAEASAAVERAFPGARLNPFGHLGDGNIHFNVLAPPGTDAAAVNDLVHGLVIASGGSISAEHGIGRYRKAALLAMRSPAEIAMMARLRAALDPGGVLNPGAVFD